MYTIGCDPEFFLVDKKGNFVPAMDTVGGTKASPRILPSGHTVQEDGCAVEIGIIPATSAKEFKDHVRAALNDVKAILKSIGLSPKFVSQAEFPKETLSDPRAWQIGCDPDYDIYEYKKTHMTEYTDNIRYAGGHIHVGSEILLEPEPAAAFVRAMDVTVGYACARKDPYHDRAKSYGQAGRVRFKQYGLEYRTPSNVWLVSRPLQDYIVRCINKHLEYLSVGVDNGNPYARYGKVVGRLNSCLLSGEKDNLFEELSRGIK